MIHLPNHDKKMQRSNEVADYLAYAAEVAEGPADQLERAIVLAASLPKSVLKSSAPDLRKAQETFLTALVTKYPFVEEVLKAVNLYKVFTVSSAEPWKNYQKILAVIDEVEAINGERFTMAVMEMFIKGGTEDALLRGALQRHSSSRAVLAAYREHIRELGFSLTVDLHLDGEMFEGMSEMRGMTGMALFGSHTRTTHLDEMTALAPFSLGYFVKAPKLAMLLPLRGQIKSIGIQTTCTDYTPLLQFEVLEKIIVVNKDVGKIFALLGHRPNLMITDSSNSCSEEGAARLRAEYDAAIKGP